MNNQVKLIDQTKLLECLNKELEFCIKEKFNEKNTRFYLGRETVLTDIINQIETGKFAPDTPPVPTIKPGDRVKHPIHGFGTATGKEVRTEPWIAVQFDNYNYLTTESIKDLEVVE